MFNSEFFPTPKSLVSEMLTGYTTDQLSEMTILEPSAGKGDIIDVLFSRMYGWRGKPKVFCIENNFELQQILIGKKYNLLDTDFLQFVPEHHFDLILMNPPFSNGDEHLLKAWEISNGTDIVCILNAETVRNPYTERRKLLKIIIDENGTVEYKQKAFETAERKTSVEIAIVRLKKQRIESKLDLEFEAQDSEESIDIDFSGASQSSSIAHDDKLGALVRCYEESKNAYIEYRKAFLKMASFANQIIPRSKSIEEIIKEADSQCRSKEEFNEQNLFESFSDTLRLYAWKSIVEKLGAEKYMTSAVSEKFREFVDNSGTLSISRKNIAMIIKQIIGSADSIMQTAVSDVFDIFTRYHDENRCHVEGWKTNSGFKVNRKVILPYGVDFKFGRFGTSYSRWDDYSDIDKAMCYVAGKQYESILTIEDSLNKSFQKDSSGKCESEFFDIRYFKKGTIHLIFKDESVWNRFNIMAAQGKGWIGR